MLSRTLPELLCTVLLALEEWRALYCAIHHTPTLLPTLPTLQEAVYWSVRLGGFLGRPGDGEPGMTTVWWGFQHLADLTTLSTSDVGKGYLPGERELQNNLFIYSKPL